MAASLGRIRSIVGSSVSHTIGQLGGFALARHLTRSR